MTPTAFERFWSKVLVGGNGCWEWQGATDRDGYGTCWPSGRVGGGKRAHRVSYQTRVGPIPASAPCVLHRCDNPKCVRPSHLFTGTSEENTADRTRKGRSARGDHNGARTKPETRLRGETWHSAHPDSTRYRGDQHWVRQNPGLVRGENNGYSKVTEAIVTEMRRRFDLGESVNSIKARMGLQVTRQQVVNIVKRRQWRHVA